MNDQAATYTGQHLAARILPTDDQSMSPLASYPAEVVIFGGAEVEGGAATIEGTGQIIQALNVGSAIPPAGSIILVDRIDQCWVFRWS